MELKWVRKINGMVGQSIPFDMFMDSIARFGHLLFVLYGLWLWLGGREEDRPRRRQAALIALAGVGICSAVSFLAGRLWARPRPFAEDQKIWNFTGHKANASFPSNHTMNSAVIAMVLWGMKMPLRFVMAGLAALLAFSRLFAGIHYPSDLAGGAGIALAVYYGVLQRPSVIKAAGAAAAVISRAGEAARCLAALCRLIGRFYGK